MSKENNNRSEPSGKNDQPEPSTQSTDTQTIEGNDPTHSTRRTADNSSDFIQDNRSAGEILEENYVRKYIKYSVGIFLATGIGSAVSFFMLSTLLPDTLTQTGVPIGGGFAFVGLIMTFFFTPLLGTLVGIVIGLEMKDTRKSAGITAGVGSYAGFVALMIVSRIFVSLLSDAGGGGSFGLTAALGWGIGVAVAGAATAVLTKKILEDELDHNPRSR